MCMVQKHPQGIIYIYQKRGMQHEKRNDYFIQGTQ